MNQSPNDDGNAMEMALLQMDQTRETSGPDDLDAEEAAGLQDLENDPETAAVSMAADQEAEEENDRDVAAVQRRGIKMLTPAQAKVLQKRATKRGKKAAAKVITVAKSKGITLGPMKRPAGLVDPRGGMKRLVDRWASRGEAWTVNQAGHYYAVAEVKFTVSGNATRAVAFLAKNTKITFFDKAIGDAIEYLGNADVATLKTTNLQRPSKNTYNDQDFYVKSISMRECGFRVKYAAGDISGASLDGIAPINDMLLGKSWLWDDSGKFIPPDIFHDFTAEDLLYRALRESGVLFFNWAKKRVGGVSKSETIPIDLVSNIPDRHNYNLNRTSGGAAVLQVADGYVITDNPEQTDEGSFTATIETTEDLTFGISPVDLGSGTAVLPTSIGLYLALDLNGVSFERVGREIRR